MKSNRQGMGSVGFLFSLNHLLKPSPCPLIMFTSLYCTDISLPLPYSIYLYVHFCFLSCCTICAHITPTLSVKPCPDLWPATGTSPLTSSAFHKGNAFMPTVFHRFGCHGTLSKRETGISLSIENVCLVLQMCDYSFEDTGCLLFSLSRKCIGRLKSVITTECTWLLLYTPVLFHHNTIK